MQVKGMNIRKDRIIEIQEVYQKLKHGTKGDVRRKLADHINEDCKAQVIQSNTMKNHWFTDEWAIPPYYQKIVLEFLTNQVKNQQDEKVL